MVQCALRRRTSRPLFVLAPMNDSRRSANMLAMIAFASLLVYAALTVRFPTESILNTARANVGSLTDKSPWAALLLLLAGLALHVGYAGAVLVAWRAGVSSHLRALVWGFPIVTGLVLMFIWPVTSTDIFDYIFRGWMAARYDANPYIDLPNAFKSDPLFKYIGWPNAPSAYGPLWELMSARMSALGGQSVWLNILLHKVLALATFLVCGLVITRMVREWKPQAEMLAGVIWLWSPLGLWEIVAIGHNDGFLILSMLLAIWATNHNRHRWAVVALVVGALFKFLPIILLPLVAAHGLRGRTTWGTRIRFCAEIAAISAVLIVLAYLPYWEGPNTLQNIAVREKFLNAAPLAIVTYTLSQWWNIDTVRPTISSIGSGLLFVGILWQMWHVWRHGRDLRAACFGLLVWYLIVASQWFQPWYVLWLMALLALRPDRLAFGWLETWAAFSQASYLLQYFILYWIEWRGNALPGQILYLVLIFVPLLVAWALGRRSRRSTPPAWSSSKPTLAT
jgi:hypothetical protein